MASSEKNLSQYSNKDLPDGSELEIAIIVSEWNEDITSSLLSGAKETLLKHGVKEDNILVRTVPGSFELPLGAKLVLSKDQKDAVICLGAVIKGETDHDKYINAAVATGIMQLSLMSNVPIIFGVLTPNNKEQAIDRAGGSHGNKGVEAAITALKMIALKKQSKERDKKIGFS